MDFKKKLSEIIKIDGLNNQQIFDLLVETADIKMGDYSLPCFTLAKNFKKSPQRIAQEIASAFKTNEWLEKAEAVNAYVNFYLNRNFVTKNVIETVNKEKESFAKSNVGQNKTIVLDYSSVNIAKQMHIGHLSTTALGNSLKNILEYLGYNTFSTNYLGDYGVPFGNIIAAHKTFGSEQELKNGGIEYVQKMYAKGSTEKENNQEFEKLGRYYFKQIQERDKEALKLYNTFKELTLNEVKPIFNLLNVKFDEWSKGEFYYSDKIEPVINKLKEKKLLVNSQGAQIIDLTKENLNVAVVIGSDGATKYITRDLAAAPDRYNNHKFDKCLYITAYEQNLHFAQLFKILEKMGYEFAKDLVHVSYGRVRLPEGKLSSRAGAKALLKDILNSAIEKALKTIETKNANLKNKKEVAKKVGIGAVIYGALANNKAKDITFDLEEALSFEGETAPYMQYTYARCSSVLQKAQQTGFTCDGLELNYQTIKSDEAFEIIKTINNFNQTIIQASKEYEPSLISKTAMNIAKNFNKFYHNNTILTDNKTVACERLQLVKAVRTALKLGLNLLGIEVVEQM